MVEFMLRYGFPIILGLWIGWMITRKKKTKNAGTHVEILDYETFKQNMRQGQLIDIRKQEAFETDRIKGARNYTVAFLCTKNQKQIRKDQALFIYCQNGKKSKRKAKKLIRNNYPHVYVLAGGFNATKSQNGSK